MGGRPEAGHRSVPHTADLRIEAWAPTRERCVAQAVAALVDSFVDVSGARPTASVAFRVDTGDSDENLLVSVLDEVIYRMDTDGQLPVDVEVSAVEGGLDVRFQLIDTDRLRPVGAVPKAVSLHELRFARTDDGWSCAVTLDV